MYKIAVLDDNYEFCITLECLLSNYFETYTFTETSVFLERIETERYDLVLLDFSILPTFEKKINNGCDLIEYLKKRFSKPPLLVLFTGWISNNALEEGRKICPLADGFLGKDAGIEEILHGINRLLAAKAYQH